MIVHKDTGTAAGSRRRTPASERARRSGHPDDDGGVETAVGDVVALGRIEGEQFGARRQGDESSDVARLEPIDERAVELPEVGPRPDAEGEVRHDAVGVDRRFAGVGVDDVEGVLEAGRLAVDARTPTPPRAYLARFDVEGGRLERSLGRRPVGGWPRARRPRFQRRVRVRFATAAEPVAVVAGERPEVRVEIRPGHRPGRGQRGLGGDGRRSGHRIDQPIRRRPPRDPEHRVRERAPDGRVVFADPVGAFVEGLAGQIDREREAVVVEVRLQSDGRVVEVDRETRPRRVPIGVDDRLPDPFGDVDARELVIAVAGADDAEVRRREARFDGSPRRQLINVPEVLDGPVGQHRHDPMEGPAPDVEVVDVGLVAVELDDAAVVRGRVAPDEVVDLAGRDRLQPAVGRREEVHVPPVARGGQKGRVAGWGRSNHRFFVPARELTVMNAPDDADGSDGAPPENLGERSGALLAALESVDVAIFILGPEFSVRWINGATERYFGLDREAVIGADKRTLIETTIRSIFEDPEAFARTVVDTYEDNTYVEEFECHVLPGEGRDERWLRHRSRPIREGDLAGGRVEHYADITDRKRREQELERQNDRLEAFASVVSHDLRNPLSVAEGHLELARQECASEHLERVQGAHDRMNVLIDDLLALAREGEAATDREAVDLAAVVERCWANVETAGATLAVDVDRTVYADESRLQQAFENLVRNAVEHGGESVTVTVSELADGFYLEDDGPGVPAGDRDSVFDVGFSTAGDGTGFGLSIVREIVEAHGWAVGVAEGAAGGARFEITGVDELDG